MTHFYGRRAILWHGHARHRVLTAQEGPPALSYCGLHVVFVPFVVAVVCCHFPVASLQQNGRQTRVARPSRDSRAVCIHGGPSTKCIHHTQCYTIMRTQDSTVMTHLCVTEKLHSQPSLNARPGTDSAPEEIDTQYHSPVCQGYHNWDTEKPSA